MAATTLWADKERYYPLHVMPYTPDKRLPGEKHDPAFCATVADCFYGADRALERALLDRRLPHVLARRGAVGRGWAAAETDHSFKEAAQALPLRAWREVTRRFRDGHTERWWVAELTLFGYGQGRPVRAICATTDRRALLDLSTWYLTTNLPSALTESVRIDSLRNWIEQGYKQMKDELGWADFITRNDRAIRRHWTLVCCAFAFCWWHHALQGATDDTQRRNMPNAPAEAGRKLAVPRRCRAGRACCARCARG